MIVLISLSLIIPFLMILSAQKRNRETELSQLTQNYCQRVFLWKKAFSQKDDRMLVLSRENVKPKNMIHDRTLYVCGKDDYEVLGK